MIDLSTIGFRKQLASKYANKYLLDTALVCALIEHESSWNPYAIRLELGFYSRYVKDQLHLDTTEAYARSMSWGLMQVMGQTAREFGFISHSLAQLCDPDTGIEFGCKKLRRCFDSHDINERAALLAYNGGSDPSYPDLVLMHKQKYF